MASRYVPVKDLLDRVFDDEFGLSESNDSNVEGEGIQGYLPEVDQSPDKPCERSESADDHRSSSSSFSSDDQEPQGTLKAWIYLHQVST